MYVGKKSLLFGVHQFLWHPATVWFAWRHLYGVPSWQETVCIIIHDWGYWFSPDMDGPAGRKHPEFAAELAGKLLGQQYLELCLYHSRHYARQAGAEPSALCWADKLSILFEPWWLYLPRAWISGELTEYRLVAAATGFLPTTASHREWFHQVKTLLVKQGRQQQDELYNGSLRPNLRRRENVKSCRPQLYGNYQNR